MFKARYIDVLNNAGKALSYKQKKQIISEETGIPLREIKKDLFQKILREKSKDLDKYPKMEGFQKMQLKPMLDHMVTYFKPEYRNEAYEESSKWYNDQEKIARELVNKASDYKDEEAPVKQPDEEAPVKQPDEEAPSLSSFFKSSFPKNYERKLDDIWRAKTNDDFPKDDFLRLAHEQENLKDYTDDDLVKLYLANTKKQYARNITKPEFKQLRKSLNAVWDGLNDCCGDNIPEFYPLSKENIKHKTKELLNKIEKTQIIKKAAKELQQREKKLGDSDLTELAEKTYAENEPLSKPDDIYFEKAERDRDEYIKQLKDTDPEMWEKLERERTENPKYYEYKMNQYAKKMYKIYKDHNNPQMNRFQNINLMRLFYERNQKKREKLENMIDEMNGLVKAKSHPHKHNTIYHDKDGGGSFLHKLVMKHNSMKAKAQEPSSPPLRKIMIR